MTVKDFGKLFERVERDHLLLMRDVGLLKDDHASTASKESLNALHLAVQQLEALRCLRLGLHSVKGRGLVKEFSELMGKYFK